MASRIKHVDLIKDPIVLAEKMIEERIDRLSKQLGSPTPTVSPAVKFLHRHGLTVKRVEEALNNGPTT